MRSRLLACSAVLVLAVTACSSPQADAPASSPEPVLPPSEPFGLDWLTLRGPDGQQVTMHVWVADLPEARRRGLMFREDLPRTAGMVFLFDEDVQSGFWMKNTLIPLSIAYFDRTGEVLAVLDMEPCAADPCPSYDPGVAYRGALEVNQGYFEEIGLEPGWVVEGPLGAAPSRALLDDREVA